MKFSTSSLFFIGSTLAQQATYWGYDNQSRGLYGAGTCFQVAGPISGIDIQYGYGAYLYPGANCQGRPAYATDSNRYGRFVRVYSVYLQPRGWYGKENSESNDNKQGQVEEAPNQNDTVPIDQF